MNDTLFSMGYKRSLLYNKSISFVCYNSSTHSYKRSTMLVHICCSVDSHFFLQKLQQLYPHEKLIGFFYDPNIHPYSEYELRLLDVKRSCAKLGVDLHVGTYNYEGWIEAVRGLEDEPEKGKRCVICFDNRLEETAQKALKLGEKVITTTLLTSPKKSLDQLALSLHHIAQKHGLEMVAPDFRKAGGTQEQFLLAKKDKLYHQDYCGCLFALSKQREAQKRWKDELSSPLRPQILPSSIEERLALYARVMEKEHLGEPVHLEREKFLNYRLLRAWVKTQNGSVIPSYILFYSCFKKESLKGKIERIEDGVGFFNKEAIRFVTLERFNIQMQTAYKDVAQMLNNPPTVESELAFRNTLFPHALLTLNPIIILDAFHLGSYELYTLTKTYDDIREILV